jgi:DNA-binding transcriptional regulator LsrR (DeoR family)
MVDGSEAGKIVRLIGNAMAKLVRDGQKTLMDAQSLRLRAAWLYYTHGLTQKDIADRLGLARTTVVKLLDELKRAEVQIRIAEGVPELIDLSLKLEDRLSLDEAIVVPGEGGADETAKAVGAALGAFLSETIRDGMRVGVGWGRTLSASLATFRPPRRNGVKVVSLLGGVVEVALTNPLEFTWRLANELGAECFLFPAPLLVDSAETRDRLFIRCGLDRLERIATALDLAVLSVGDIGMSATSLSKGLISNAQLQELCDAGCVSDTMCNFLDAEGRSVAHPLNERVMSIGLDTIARARHIVIATGGAARAQAIIAAWKRIGCNTLVTDEQAARRILELTPQPASAGSSIDRAGGQGADGLLIEGGGRK